MVQEVLKLNTHVILRKEKRARVEREGEMSRRQQAHGMLGRQGGKSVKLEYECKDRASRTTS